MHAVKVIVGDCEEATEVVIDATDKELTFLMDVARRIALAASDSCCSPDMFLELIDE